MSTLTYETGMSLLGFAIIILLRWDRAERDSPGWYRQA